MRTHDRTSENDQCQALDLPPQYTRDKEPITCVRRVLLSTPQHDQLLEMK